jgi:16S rRNA G1207 methylase RsmC
MTEHYYSEKQTSEFHPAKIKVNVMGMDIELYTAGGVFSPKQIDAGTRLLIESAMVQPGWKVLDLGCGYGIVGIAIKKKYPLATVFMSDINERAVQLSKMNIELNRIEATVLHSDVFKNKELERIKFDTILLNPPQTAGKKLCFQMIEESKQRLNKGGTLQIVARHNKGGEGLSKKMEEVFGNMAETAKKSGYRVYISENQG